MRVCLALSHCIEEYDQLRLLHSLGHEVFSIGAYITPAEPHVDKRPPLPELPFYPELKEAVDRKGGLGEAQADIPDELLEWLGNDGAIIYHHYLERAYQQPRLWDWKAGSSGRRIVWRTVGQSVEANERAAWPFRARGMEIVRYSPKERAIPSYAGEDALIRFFKDPEEWNGWVGEDLVIINLTQHLRQREPYCGWSFWERATAGLPRLPLGPGSEVIGGPGVISYEELHRRLRFSRAYLYTGTQPASYVLNMVEALMTGIPVVSIGPAWMRVYDYGPDLFEGHEIAPLWSDDPAEARKMLSQLLNDRDYATDVGARSRARALELFSRDKISAAWATFLA